MSFLGTEHIQGNYVQSIIRELSSMRVDLAFQNILPSNVGIFLQAQTLHNQTQKIPYCCNRKLHVIRSLAVAFLLALMDWWCCVSSQRNKKWRTRGNEEADWDLRYLKYRWISFSLDQEHANSFFHVFVVWLSENYNNQSLFMIKFKPFELHSMGFYFFKHLVRYFFLQLLP
jgi:hypothetical protein